MSDTTDQIGPGTDLCRSAREWVFANTPAYVANHSLRSYRFATRLGPILGVPSAACDEELLYLSCLLHDAGLTEHANGEQRFEVDGADFAKEFVLNLGLADAKAETVWMAIALHTSSGIASRMQPEIALAHAGIGCDILGFFFDEVGEAEGQLVHEGMPRLDLGINLASDVVGAAHSCADKAPPFSFPAALVEEASPVPVSPTWAEMTSGNPWNQLG